MFSRNPERSPVPGTTPVPTTEPAPARPGSPAAAMIASRLSSPQG